MLQQEIIFVVVCGLFGLLIGSFLNVVAIRTLSGRSIVHPPSACINCKHRLKPFDLVPVLSYIFLRGKCRYCKEKISLAYPLWELVCGLLFGFLAFEIGMQLELTVAMLFVSILIITVQTDMKAMIIPNRVVYFGMITLGLLRLFVHDEPLWHYAAAFLIAGGLLLLLAVLSKGGMGGGDIKLFAMIGLVLGIVPLLFALSLSSLLGLVYGVILRFAKGVRKKPIPFAPFIALGSIIAYFYGEAIVQWYVTLYV